ncbi:MAG TPA: ABC transporter ATP-binding protein [Candidatus Nanopelagicaceae bacterium]|nr:ABC transporter ATP-binding protein [Candidatus Nanopelagicaceae bacterium]
MTTPAAPAISVSGLTKKYGSRVVVDHLEFAVPKGTVCGFVGPNGAGKTTTIRMLLGLISSTAGTGEVLGKTLTHPEEYLAQVGAMIEGPAFYPYLSGRENLKVLATLGGLSHDLIDQLLAKVDLLGRASSKFKTYSLGMKQRLGIAAALLSQPELLILDEPTNGLDPAGIHEIRTLLRGLADSGITVFVSSHLLIELEQISDYLVILNEGKLLFAGQTNQLLEAQRGSITAKAEREEDLTTLGALVLGLGYATSYENGVLHVFAPADWAAELNRIAFGAGIVLSGLSTSRPSLEDTFFNMIGGAK